MKFLFLCNLNVFEASFLDETLSEITSKQPKNLNFYEIKNVYFFHLLPWQKKRKFNLEQFIFKAEKTILLQFFISNFTDQYTVGPRYLRELRPTKDTRIPKPRITREHFHDVSMLKIVQKPRLSDGKYQFAISKFRYQIVNHELSKPQILKTNIMSISF